MKTLLKVLLLGSFVATCHGQTVELKEKEVFVPHRLGSVTVFHNEDGFHVVKEDTIYDIQACDCDKELRGITSDTLVKFLGRNNPPITYMTAEQLNEYQKTTEDKLCKIPQEQADKMFKTGYLVLDEVANGVYTLKAKCRLLGSGPWLGWGLYWGVKIGVVVLLTTATGGAGGVAAITTGMLVKHVATKALMPGTEIVARGAQVIGTLIPCP